MDRESLESRSRLHSLEAENKHLKSLLSRVVAKKREGDVRSSSSIIIKLEEILEGNYNYRNVIKPILKEFGELVAVDRVSIFSYDNKDKCFYATHQWVNSDIQEYHPYDLTIKESENPLNNPTHGSSFACSNFQNNIQQSLSEKLEIFQVQSILIIPFKSSEFANGMFVLESCHFNREWYDFEVTEIEEAVCFFSNSLNFLWQKYSADQALELSCLQNEMSRKLQEEGGSRKVINDIFQILGSQLKFNSIYIVDKNSFSNNHEMLWAGSMEMAERCLSNVELENLDLKEGNVFVRILSSNLLPNSDVGMVGSKLLLIVGNIIGFQNEFKGWLVGEINSDHHYPERILTQFWESISLLISEALDRVYLENELNSYKHKFLKANETLSVKESFLNSILNHSPLGILIVKNRMITYANDHVVSVLGCAKNEAVGKKISDFYTPLDADFEEKVKGFYLNIDKQGQASEEVSLVNRLGDQKRICFFGSKEISEHEDSYLLFTIDITESYSAKKEIQENRERYRKILESTADGVIILSKNDSVHFINRSFCRLLGYTYQEAMLLKRKDFISKEYLGIFENVISEIDLGVDSKSDFVLCKKDKSFLEAEVCGTLIQLDGIDHFYFSIHDISTHKHNEKILSAREVEFRSLAENSPDIILRLNKSGHVLFFNQAFIDQFSFLNEKEVIGRSLEDLGVLDRFVSETWQTKVNDVFLLAQKMSMELGFSDETKELYYDWKLSPEINEKGEVGTILAVGRNLTLRKTAEKQLLLAKEKAEESDKLKSAFLANISHELRTPLNAIVGFSALLRGDDVSAQEKEEYIDVIHKNSDSLMELISNIIDVAKIESGKISLVKELVSIDALMSSLYDWCLPKIKMEHKGRVKLSYREPKETEVDILTDPIRLRQVFVNLLENAIKFTIKGFVEFGYSLDNDEVRFFVKDTGIGISEAKQNLIFQSFSKEDEGIEQIFGGTGIGLPISEKLVSALGGKMGLVSEKGQGSEFFFTHPVGHTVEQSIDVKEKQEFSGKTYTISQPVQPKNYYWHNKLVLLVDENSSAHLQMRKFFEKTGLTLVSARTAAGASKLLMNRNDIKLVLMDLSFPDSDGYELVRIIKAQNKNIPVIAHSVRAHNGEKEKLLQCGFDDCVSKPTEKDVLLMVMDKYLVSERFSIENGK